MKKNFIMMVIILGLFLILINIAYASCTDTDNGNNYAVKGTVIDNSGSFYTDYCSGDVQVCTSGGCINRAGLTEYFCTSSGGYGADFATCSVGQKCIDGMCTDKVCQGEKNYFVYKEACVGSECKADVCLSRDILKEYYCVGDSVTYDEFKCTNVIDEVTRKQYYCIEGKCELGNCVSEWVESPYCKTNKEVWQKIRQPDCSVAETVKQYCDTGYICQGGFCIPGEGDNCVDSDGGKDFFVKGNVQKVGFDAIYDKCINDATLQENYCSLSGDVMIAYEKCGKGCNDGACVGGGFNILDWIKNNSLLAVGILFIIVIIISFKKSIFGWFK